MNINTYSTHFDDISIRNFRTMKPGAKEPRKKTGVDVSDDVESTRGSVNCNGPL